MGRHQLIIDNQIADVFSDGDIMTAISYMVSAIADIDKSSNPTTKTMKLPGTNRNKRIFGFPDDLSVSDFKGQKVSLLGSVKEDGTDILTGIVNLKDVTRTGADVVFNVTIIGNGGEWVETMKSADLNGIDLNCTHQKTVDTINASLVLNSPYGYGLVNNGFSGVFREIDSIEDNGQGFCKCKVKGTSTICNLPNSTLSGTVVGSAFGVTSYNVKHTITNIQIDNDGYFLTLGTRYSGDSSGIFRAVKGRVSVEDRPLLLNARTVLRKIFDLAGYQISSNFIDSEYFRRLYVLPGKEKHRPEFVTTNAVKMGIWGEQNNIGFTGIAHYLFSKPIKNDALLYDPATGYFTATEAMHLLVKASWNLKGTDDYIAYPSFDIQVATGQPAGISRDINRLTLDSANFSVLDQEAELRLYAGQRFAVGLQMGRMGGVAGDLVISPDETYIEITVTDKIIKNSIIAPGNFLPEIKQIDLVKALRHVFNLYFLTDMAMKTVYIEPRNTFYRTDKAIDLTGKLDAGKAVIYEELGSELTKSIAFRYKEDGADWGVKEWETANGKRYSTYVASILNKFSQDGETVIENPTFAATLMAGFPSIGLSTMLPKIWQALPDGDIYPEVLDEYEPRLLHFAGIRNCTAGETWVFESLSKSNYPLYCSKDSETGNDNSLLFEQDTNELDLYRMRYENYIRTLNEGRKITAYFNLNASDIQALMTPDAAGVIVKDFRSQVYFRHGGEVTNCRLDSVVDYKPGMKDTTKVVLITDVDNTFYNAGTPGYRMEFINNEMNLPYDYANGSIYLNSWNWSDVRNRATGQAVSNTTVHGIGASGGGSTGAAYLIERAFLFFDTSPIPEGAMIYSAYLDIYKLSGDPLQELTLFEGTQANVLTSYDYQRFGTVPFGETAHGVLGVRRIMLNAAGIAAINKTGRTKYCLRETHFDVGNVTPNAVFPTFRTHFIAAPIAQMNKLTVKYTL